MMNSTYPFELPPLGFAENALEPYIDAETVHYHHEKHFASYISNLNKALEPNLRLRSLTLTELLSRPAMLPAQARTSILRNGGGVFNHALYFDMLTPPVSGGLSCRDGEIEAAIARTFGSFDEFKARFSAAAGSVFGSGWTLLVSHPRTGLHIMSVANQDTVVREGLRVHLIFDVWEHAYYLKYKNRRAEYIEGLWNVVQFLR